MLRNQDSQAEQQLTDNQKMEEVVTVTESLGSSFIFLFKQFLPLAGLGSAIFFPLAAAGGLIRGILKMREAYLEKSENKSGAILRASVEILTALAITAAAIFTPLIFIPTLAFKTLFHFFATIYYGVRSLLSPELPQQKMNREKMIMNLAFTVTHTISTVATSLVFIAEQTQFGILGVMGCMLAVAYVLCKTCSTTKQRPASLNISQLSNNRGPEAFLRKGPAISRELVEEKKLQDENTRTFFKKVSTKKSPPKTDFKKDLTEANQLDEQRVWFRQEKLTLFKTSLKKALTEKKRFIYKEMKQLEKNVRDHHAFGQGFMRWYQEEECDLFKRYWWEVLYKEEYPRRSKELKIQMDQINEMITIYNKLVEEHKAILESDRLQNAIKAENRLRGERRDEEEKDEDIQNRTGGRMSRAALREIGNIPQRPYTSL